MMKSDKPWKLLGAGATAEIYALGDGQVIKLYRPWVPEDLIYHEANATRMAHEFGLPVPRIYEVIVDDNQRGIVMERVDGPMIVSLMMTRFWKSNYYARILAELQVKINALEAPQMPPLRPRLEKNIRNETIIPEDTKEAVLDVLQELPDGEAFCHFDLHPLNVIMSPRGPVIIDWSGAAKGDPMADIARSWLLCTLAAVPMKPIRGILNAWRRGTFARILKEYSHLAPISRERFELWKIPIIAARLPEEPNDEQKKLLLAALEKQLRIVKSA